MEEKWTRWEPIDGLEGQYAIKSVIEDTEAFTLNLFKWDDSKKKVLITFDGIVCSYRSTDETYRDKLICDLEEKYGATFLSGWTFFKVNNSNYVKWLSEQSYGISDHFSCTQHFSILGVDCVFDIIASYEPKVEIINE